MLREEKTAADGQPAAAGKPKPRRPREQAADEPAAQKPDAKTDTKPDTKPEAKTDAKPATKTADKPTKDGNGAATKPKLLPWEPQSLPVAAKPAEKSPAPQAEPKPEPKPKPAPEAKPAEPGQD